MTSLAFNKPSSAAPVDLNRLKDRLTKAHVKLLTHPETTLFGGVILMGKSEIVDYIPTAATDGVNCFYGAEFCDKQSDAQLRFVVMHEKGHIALRHLLRHKDIWEEDPMTANCAADYAINGLIMSFTDKTLCEPPTVPMLHDAKYNGWSFGEIYRDLKQNRPPQPTKPKKEDGEGQGQGQGQDQGQDQEKGNAQSDGDKNEQDDQQGSTGESGDTGRPCEPKPGEQFGGQGQPFDYHDWTKTDGMSAEEIKDLSDQVARAIEQGGLLAGKQGQTVPRVVAQANAPQIDWKTQLNEFVNTATIGKDDDMSMRRLDRRWLEMDIVMPTPISETVGEVLYLSDTSGSISDKQNAETIGELSSLVQNIQPERVRVLWWDDRVHGEQVFMPDQFDKIKELAKPVGGGGTRVTSCADYVKKNQIKADCAIVMTDGYVEDRIDWSGMPPTIWIVTGNRGFNPPSGRVVFMD